MMELQTIYPPMLQLSILKDPFHKHLMQSVSASWDIKPNGGLWLSSYNPNYGSDWVRWCKSEEPSWINGKHPTLFTLRPDLNIYCINSLQDLINAPFKSTSPLNFQSQLSWEKAVKDGWDGVYLTAEGQGATRFSYPTLYGWDCESMVMFHPNFFEEFEEIPFNEIWRL